MNQIIGIGEYAISDDCEDVIKTCALSSCVALTVYSPLKKILGMVHIALPDSNILQGRELVNPAYYADTAVSLLVCKICSEYGCTRGELEVKLFGGAKSIRKNDVFNIGKRNMEMIECKLAQMNLRVCQYDTGGCLSRTIEADVATGLVKVIYQQLNI